MGTTTMQHSEDDAPITEDIIAVKSDQLNADDLIGGPRTITITRVSAGSNEQPRNFHYEGDGGKPWRPCKTMMRVILRLWGPSGYRGRQITLVRDPEVSFGKNRNCGGIRISAMSHLSAPEVSESVRISKDVRKTIAIARLETAAPTKPPGNITEALATIEKWTGDVAPLRAGLSEKSWTKEERAQIKAALEGKS
jgi:hypothetical protein